ncbi:uncharacterized protein LOC124606378 [Schistocerca americana]|uniref:uncharacterized protein LOC124606378 n=1 Tax=Schistocerca americana TaxID=7009 RepID=UPI001F5018C6|nr:uncharacterized protein LOC124606378 [Schistocerca americana]
MGPRMSMFALLVLLLVAAGDAHHKPSHATRHGGRVRAAHRAGKASPVARSKGASEEPLLVTIKAAKELEFDFGDDGTLEKELRATGRYDPKQVLGYDVDECPEYTLTAYSSDTRGNVLSVTDLTTRASKHLQSQYFHPKPSYLFTKAGGPSYNLPDGLKGVTAEERCNGRLYFQAFASNIQGFANKQVVLDAKDGDVLDIKMQGDLPGELPGQSGVMAVDPKGQLLIFPVLDEMAIYCWNTSKPQDPKNFRVIFQNDERLHNFNCK